MRISKAEQGLNYAILIAFAAVAIYPILSIVIAAMQPDGQAPGGVENLVQAWQIGRFGSYLLASVMVSAFVVVVGAILSIVAGFALGTMRFAGANVIFYLMLLGIMMPAEAIVVPLYFDLRALSLIDTFWAVALPQLAQSVAFGTFWMRAAFRASPRSLIEAARIDGASTARVLVQILVPLVRPAVVTLLVLTFMWTWNEFLIPLVMMPTNEALRTAPLGLGFFSGQYTQGFALLAAGATIVALPVVVVYVFLQRHFIAGMLEGAIKD